MDDPAFNGYTHIDDLPAHRLDELRHFFQDYKTLEKKEVQVRDFFGPDEAKMTILQALQLYRETYRADENGNR